MVPELLAGPSLVVEGFPAMLPSCAYLVSFPLASPPSPPPLFLQLMTVLSSSSSALLMMLMFFLYNFDDCC